MDIKEQKEILTAKQAALADKIKSAGELAEKVKSVEPEKFDEMQKAVDTATAEVGALKSEIETMEKAIAAEEKAVEELAKKGIEEMEKTKNTAAAAPDYLGSKAAMNDFADVLIACAGKSRDAVKKAWGDVLREKGITNPDVLFPTPVVSAIKDKFDAAGGIFATLKKIYGVTVWANAFNTVTGTDGRAQGYKTGETKKEQKITLDTKEISCDFIYKYIQIPKKVLKETQSTGAVVKYVLEELPQRIVWEIERAAVIGDGRVSTSDDKIKSIEAITAAGTGYTASVSTTGSLYTDLIMLIAEIKAAGSIYLVTDRKLLAQLKTEKDANDALLLPVGSDIKGLLGVADIFTPDWFTAGTTAGSVVAVAYVGDAYVVIGDSTIENYENFILAQNQHEYLAELYTGGALMEFDSAAVLKVKTA